MPLSAATRPPMTPMVPQSQDMTPPCQAMVPQVRDTEPQCQPMVSPAQCAPVTEHLETMAATRTRIRWAFREISSVAVGKIGRSFQDKGCDCSNYPTYEYGAPSYSPPSYEPSYNAPSYSVPSYNPPCAYRRTFGPHKNKEKDPCALYYRL